MASHARTPFKDPTSAILPIQPPELGRRKRRSAERVDGASGSGDAYRRRGSRRSAEPLPLGSLQFAEVLVSRISLWEKGDLHDRLAPQSQTGRRRQCKGVLVALVEELAEEYGSVRRALREIRDPHSWNRLRMASRHLSSFHPSWVLPEQPPSRSQIHRFKALLNHEDASSAIREFDTAEAIKVAQHMGMYDPCIGSMTHPASTNTTSGDGSWLRGPLNRPPDDILYDENGERTRRIDPDCYRKHERDTVTGRNVVSVLGRTPFPHERVMLDICSVDQGIGDADTYVDMVLRLSKRIPIQASTYDMAFDGENADALLRHRIVPVTKVPRDDRNEPWVQHIDELDLRLADGSVERKLVTAVDGWPSVTLPTVEGPRQFAFSTKTVKARGPVGSSAMYLVAELPDTPEVPRRYRRAAIWVRLNSTDDEVRRKDRRTRALRAFPETSETFTRLFGLREDTESMHHHLKSTLTNRRARVVGKHRWQMMLGAYQSVTNTKALLAWWRRTGGDVSLFFGDWVPPPLRHASAA